MTRCHRPRSGSMTVIDRAGTPEARSRATSVSASCALRKELTCTTNVSGQLAFKMSVTDSAPVLPSGALSPGGIARRLSGSRDVSRFRPHVGTGRRTGPRAARVDACEARAGRELLPDLGRRARCVESITAGSRPGRRFCPSSPVAVDSCNAPADRVDASNSHASRKIGRVSPFSPLSPLRLPPRAAPPPVAEGSPTRRRIPLLQADPGENAGRRAARRAKPDRTRRQSRSRSRGERGARFAVCPGSRDANPLRA